MNEICKQALMLLLFWRLHGMAGQEWQSRRGRGSSYKIRLLFSQNSLLINHSLPSLTSSLKSLEKLSLQHPFAPRQSISCRKPTISPQQTTPFTLATMGITKVTLSMALALAGSLQAVNALGCYSDGGVLGDVNNQDFRFGHLHNRPMHFNDYEARDLTEEVKGDIRRVCELVDGSTVSPDTRWSDCSDWAWEGDNIPCPEYCAPETDTGLWTTDCFEGCSPGNHISWEIAHDGNGDDTRTMTYDVCVSAFETELGGCENGSEQNHDGFWFRIDPNVFSCAMSG